ncbi:MAG TPA: metallophosphatase [Bacteroidia bacterium]|nr:metallophosphatase [Bacteroidia bacterium]
MEEFQDKSRRKFIRNVTGGILAAGLGMNHALAETDPDLIKLTILHTNDVHSHIDPFDDNHPKYPGMGGVAQRAALISKIRQEERNVLLLDAGDIFQGTPYFNMYGGELEMKLMSKMGYDAATIGNHDFDNGIEGLVKQLPHACFPLINCNYDFTGTPMEGKSVPYKILTKNGLRIGILGVGIELAGLVDKRLYSKTKYLDPLVQSHQISSYLKRRKKCDLVICLSHLGHSYKSDKISDLKLAESSENIDLIIGGHTHTFLDEPVKIMNKHEKEVLVTQAGWAGLRLGKIDYYFSGKLKKNVMTTSTMKEMKKSSEK